MFSRTVNSRVEVTGEDERVPIYDGSLDLSPLQWDPNCRVWTDACCSSQTATTAAWAAIRLLEGRLRNRPPARHRSSSADRRQLRLSSGAGKAPGADGLGIEARSNPDAVSSMDPSARTDDQVNSTLRATPWGSPATGNPSAVAWNSGRLHRLTIEGGDVVDSSSSRGRERCPPPAGGHPRRAERVLGPSKPS